jgi:hypothetical protein
MVSPMIAARQMQVAVIAVEQRPDSAWVLSPDEIQFVTVGLKQATAPLAQRPTGAWVQMVWDQGVALIEFVFGEFFECLGHGGILSGCGLIMFGLQDGDTCCSGQLDHMRRPLAAGKRHDQLGASVAEHCFIAPEAGGFAVSRPISGKGKGGNAPAATPGGSQRIGASGGAVDKLRDVLLAVNGIECLVEGTVIGIIGRRR